MDTFGFPPTQWNAAKTEARNAMIDRARRAETLSYTELVSEIRAVSFDPRDIRLDTLLGEISTEEDSHRRGMLSVVVVHKGDDQLPGHGFFELAERLGRETRDKVACWVNELKVVYRSWASRP
jgi:hypothetical protein